MGCIVSYGKKPRKSKTSEVIELDDLSFFLYNAKSTTKGTCEIYLNKEPYPLINVAMNNEKAKLWLKDNLTRVKEKVSSLACIEFISREEFVKIKKPEKDTVNTNKIHYPTPEECQEMFNKHKKELR
jgi:hypothetical protein